MIEAVIFDMDGLLIDSESLTFKMYKDICGENGVHLEDEFYLTLLGTNAKFIEEKLGDYLGSRLLAIRIIKDVHNALKLYFDIKGIPVKKGVIELIEFLKKRDIKLAVATSSCRKRAIKILEKSRMLHFFDVIICGDEVKNGKPDPEIFMKACEALNKKRERVLVLEDSENGIVAAHTGGMKCINIPDLKEPSTNVKLKSECILEDLSGVIRYIEKLM